MKKFLCATLAAVMLTATACAPSEPAPADAGQEAVEESAGGEAADATTEEAKDIKIGIVTGTVSQNEEEFRAAENMKAKYGDMIETATYPDNFTQEQETLISNTLALAENGAGAIVFVQGVAGTSAAIDKVHEQYPDVLFIVGQSAEDPAVVASKADIVMNADEIGMGTAVIEQAHKMGAKTFVHYTFPRHMSVETLKARRDLFEQTCKDLGIQFVDATAPDPTSDAGVAGAQQFILEDVPRKVAEYGKETAFFATNCSMQEPLIRSVLQEGALYPQQCCPSPYHGYPGALGIAVPEDKKGNVPYIVEAITTAIGEKGGTGRFSTWPVPVQMMFVEAGVEYAKAYLNGDITDRNDDAKIIEVCNNIIQAGGEGEATFSNYTTPAGEKLDNYYFVLSDFINF